MFLLIRPGWRPDAGQKKILRWLRGAYGPTISPVKTTPLITLTFLTSDKSSPFLVHYSICSTCNTNFKVNAVNSYKLCFSFHVTQDTRLAPLSKGVWKVGPSLCLWVLVSLQGRNEFLVLTMKLTCGIYFLYTHNIRYYGNIDSNRIIYALSNELTLAFIRQLQLPILLLCPLALL